MLNFEYFIKKGTVYKRQPDIELAKSLVEDSSDRIKSAKEDTERKPKYAFEDAYEAVIVILDALLYIEGYKSYSHEANIAFLVKFNDFTLTEIENLDRLRKKRHNSKYYAQKIQHEEAKEDIEFLDNIFKKIILIVTKRLQ